MAEHVPLKTAAELSRLADIAANAGDDAATIPLPAGPAAELKVAVLFYEEPAIPDVEEVYSPGHKVLLHAETGKVLESRPCTPRDFGLGHDPARSMGPFGLDPSISGKEFWRRVDRLMEISHLVWAAYFRKGSLKPASMALIEEYSGLFESIVKKPLVPYYRAVGGEFLGWLDTMVKRSKAGGPAPRAPG